MTARPIPATQRVNRQEVTWGHLEPQMPRLVATCRRYLGQLSVSARPATVDSYDQVFRIFCLFLTEHHPEVKAVSHLERSHIETYKQWLAATRGRDGGAAATNTIRRSLGHLRVFLERITEWGYDDAPMRTLVFAGDLPPADEPLPKFLDDARAARLMRAVTGEPDLLRRLPIELLARTGMRVGELCDLEDDCVTQIGDSHWLRIPVGKLHNDRYVPLHPHLVHLIAEYRQIRPAGASGRLLVRPDGQPLERYWVARALTRIGKQAGIGHVSPHQLRHTLATQAINRGMSLEAIAALLGHKSLAMTLVYARIADRTLADEYFNVSQRVEALYQNQALPADSEGPAMRRVRIEHRKMLGNGWCVRPIELDCTFESICETCSYYDTSIEFQPILLKQRDHAADHNQTKRAALFDGLLQQLDKEAQ